MQQPIWIYKHFCDLSATELYDILSLRNKVFVVEQNCVYDDTDKKDLDAWHLCGYVNEELAAYARILSPGVSYKEASIGRVITNPNHRGKGLGIELMNMAIQETLHQFKVTQIRISAQKYLLKFYGNLGFESTGKEYLEDNIPHVEMLLNNEASVE